MAVPNEGTTALPSDASGRYFLGRWNGTGFYAQRMTDVFKTVTAQQLKAGGGGYTLWTPALGKKWRVLGFSFSVKYDASIYLCDASVSNVSFPTPLIRAGQVYTIGGEMGNFGNGVISGLADRALLLDCSRDTEITGAFWGCEE